MVTHLLYVLLPGNKNSTLHRVLAIFVIYGAWVNLAIVRALHLFKLDILSFLFLLTYVLIERRF